MNTINEIQEYIEAISLELSKHTVSSYKASLKKFIDILDINEFIDITLITPKDCREFQAKLLEQGLARSSVNSHTRPLKAFYNWLIDNEYTERSPFDKVKALKTGKKNPNFLTDEEILAMVKGCKNDMEKLMISLLVLCGLRRNELITLKLENITECHITVEGKGSKERTLALTEDTCQLLRKYRTWRLQKYKCREYLFISLRKKLFTGSGIRYKINEIARRGGISEKRIEEVAPHVLRHTFATNLVDNDVNIRTIQAALGHSSLKATQIYTHVKNKTLDSALSNQKSILNGA